MTYDLWLLLGLFALDAAACAAMWFSFVPGTACGCPLGTHERGSHDRTRRPSPLPAPAPTPELPKAPPKLSPTFDPIKYLEPQDRAWLDGQLDLTRPLFPPPPEK